MTQLFYKIKKNGYTQSLLLFFLILYTIINPLASTAILNGCYYGSLLLFVGLSVEKRAVYGVEWQTPLRKSAVFFVFWVLIGLVGALDVPHSWHDIYSHLFKYMALCFMLAVIGASPKKMTAFSMLFTASIVGCVLYYLIFVYVIDGHPFSHRSGNAHGFSNNLINIHALFAIFFCICNFITIRNKYGKIAFVFLMMPLLATVILTQTKWFHCHSFFKHCLLSFP